MCGIVGYVDRDIQCPGDEGVVRAMCSAIRHRGPDDEGTYCAHGVAMGVRRLSIIDLAGGHQPIHNEDETVWVVFNGEIYNFAELREQLEAKGHRFRTRTDTEVIAHLYEEFGPDCVDHLRGMFAFAVWDAARRSLLLARDRVGKKPLFYTEVGGRLYFASEIKALLTVPEIARRPDRLAILDFLVYGYTYGERTAFEGVRRLPPAHVLTWSEGQIATRRYWHPDHSAASESDPATVLPTLLDLLDEAVRIRLVSDVPLGLLLSGGIDSGLTLAMMSRASDEPVETFSIGFAERQHDESHTARQVAAHFGAEHTERIVTEEELYRGLPRAVWNAEEPTQDYSFLPTEAVCRLARSRVTVALSGDGGDESFGGYELYIRDEQYDPRSLALARAPRLVRAAVGAAGAVLGTLGPTRSLGDRLSRLSGRASETPEQRYLRKRSLFPDFEVAQLLSAEMAEAVRGHDPGQFLLGLLAETPRQAGLNQLLHADLQSYLACDVLVKVDRCAMANSLEVRCPFLDHHVVEYAARIMSDLKVREEVTKWILREAARGLLPAGVSDLPKMGFGIPLDEWMRGRMAPRIDQVVLSSRALSRGYFRPELIRMLRDQHLTGRYDQSVKLYMLLNLELWHRTFIDGQPACGDERIYDA